ncbi:MAG: ATP-dependent protease subunit HslV [Planctomycetota bacterium]
MEWLAISANHNPIRSTTILSVRRDGKTAIGGDGQVTLGETAVKHDTNKIRRLCEGKVLCGFAGSAADSFALLDRFEGKLEQYKGNIRRAAIELAKDWRTDRVLRRLESLLAAVDKERSLIIGGSGDVIEPTDGIIGIGSGGMYAAAAARALLQHSSLGAADMVKEALLITADICIYTNNQITVETLE